MGLGIKPSFSGLGRVLALCSAVAALGGPLAAQTHPGRVSLVATETSELRSLDQQITAMLRTGELQVQRVQDDAVHPGSRHERLAQSYRGVPVFGGDLTRQTRDGVAVSSFGVLYRGINIEATPTLTLEEAAALAGIPLSYRPGRSDQPRLFILPQDDGTYALSYYVRVVAVPTVTVYFIDAHTGAVLRQYDDLKTQAIVGQARGVLNDSKKISVESRMDGFIAVDRLRPQALSPDLRSFNGTATFDLQGNPFRINDILSGTISGESEIARDSDNHWTDGSVSDAHVYAGWFVDYLFKRFGRRGLDDNYIELWNFTNPIRLADFSFNLPEGLLTLYNNASYLGFGNMVYGVGLPSSVRPGGQQVLPLAGALDVVAHELAHGVTEFTSDLVYQGEAGALNEAFSDIIGESVERFFQAPGAGPMQADYLIGEDVVIPGGVRSMSDPLSYGDPDHYSRRFIGSADNGGVHTNSNIANHAFYLAVEGGRNRTSGLTVQGVGTANHEQMERIFYRAFAFMLPSNATFYLARLATIQSARELYGAGSPAERAVSQAWDAVGVLRQANIAITFDRNPVPPSPGACGVTRGWFFRTTLTELNGVGYTVSGFILRRFDGNGNFTNSLSFTAAEFAQLFNDCGPGSSRIGPNGQACAAACLTGGLREGEAEFVFQGRDDTGRGLAFTSERLRLLPAAPVTPSEPIQALIGRED